MEDNNKKHMLIGLLGHQHAGRYNPGYGQNAAYVDYFRTFGDVIIIDSQCEQVIPVDLLVLPGGRDVNPLRYNQKPLTTTQTPDLEYEWFFANMFKHYLDRAKEGLTAIYGICAGFQNLVVEFGGTLAQSAAQEQSTNFRGDLVDFLTFDEKNVNKHISEDYKISKNVIDFKKTNSIHHQSAFPSDIPEEFNIIATNKRYDNVEFIIHDHLPIAAEQSHPEERVNPLLTDSLINNIVNKLKNFV